LNRAPELCLTFNSSVNAYRRLDPNFEAPNQIKVSASDRGSMIRIPLANEKTARIEIRSVAPDSNPYLALYSLLRTGIDDVLPKDDKADRRPRVRFLPGTIGDAIRLFKASDYMTDLLGDSAKGKYVDWKVEVSHRSSRDLGTTVKDSEVLYHHEVTNQYLWNQF
ncbi:MAG: glutamine synthetase, partial [Candidatus Saccharibacteria bacterium]|nr:glutamine synthetase [Candidatus Saccharibacteria bacterium]